MKLIEMFTSNRSYAEQEGSEYLLVIDADAHVDNPSTLTRLMALNRGVVAPIMTRHDSKWSNFWGALSEKGFYARQHDYIKIVENQIR